MLDRVIAFSGGSRARKRWTLVATQAFHLIDPDMAMRMVIVEALAGMCDTEEQDCG